MKKLLFTTVVMFGLVNLGTAQTSKSARPSADKKITGAKSKTLADKFKAKYSAADIEKMKAKKQQKNSASAKEMATESVNAGGNNSKIAN